MHFTTICADESANSPAVLLKAQAKVDDHPCKAFPPPLLPHFSCKIKISIRIRVGMSVYVVTQRRDKVRDVLTFVLFLICHLRGGDCWKQICFCFKSFMIKFCSSLSANRLMFLIQKGVESSRSMSLRRRSFHKGRKCSLVPTILMSYNSCDFSMAQTRRWRRSLVPSKISFAMCGTTFCSRS